ncbi:replication initiation regulator SeqA [Psychromonas sp. psych-6C06]|uniref:replication initiation regulator SeqA n=1 Tax=Psychromonas sp. psych-6C06 TaxID=2058089 RepID=UPI000C31F00C|nr:replication initiation regulator SeqA [Psychromonas sp. psych-6C06]PKF60487.1 replication initiation regulator SeqA [Psychromonas sp. psych-6C06]
MKQIDIEDDLYKFILNNIQAFGETPSQILRRLLNLPPQISAQKTPVSDTPALVEEEKIIVETAIEEDLVKASPEPAPAEKSGAHSFAGASLPEAFSHGIEALFKSETFQKEPVITNKFKMMLTTMYYENRSAFIEAAKVAKGRSRDYLGENLEQLLASDNKEEVDLLIASKPRDIPYTPFWVVTNANTGRKRIILTQVMAYMGYPHHLIERIKEEI